MKYEIKGNYRFILGILAIVMLASTIIQIKISNEINKSYLNQSSSFNLMEFLTLMAMFVVFGAFLIAFFRIIGSFRNELYEDRGFLTFTLPLTGNQIVGAKLIVAAMWIIVLGVGTGLYNLILASIIFKLDWNSFMQIVKEVMMYVDLRLMIRVINSSLIMSGISLLNTLIFIYFSMALSKVSIRNKKIGGMWFIIFLILNMTSVYLVTKVGNLLPLYLDLESFRISNISDPWFNTSYNSFTSNIMYGFSPLMNLNITSVIAQVIVSIGAFIGTGYLIENKIDL